jgi:hypothetical protein
MSKSQIRKPESGFKSRLRSMAVKLRSRRDNKVFEEIQNRKRFV